MEIDINYSINIEKIAKRRGLTIQQMLENSGVNSSSYYKMKNNNKFTTETLEKLANALNVEVADLVKKWNKDDKKEMLNDFEKIRDKLDDFEEKHLK